MARIIEEPKYKPGDQVFVDGISDSFEVEKVDIDHEQAKYLYSLVSNSNDSNHCTASEETLIPINRFGGGDNDGSTLNTGVSVTISAIDDSFITADHIGNMRRKVLANTWTKFNNASGYYEGPFTIDFLGDGSGNGSSSTPKKSKPKKKPRARKPKPTVTFDSVILEAEKKEAIEEALAQRKNYKKIFKTWGFEQTMEKGKATSFLFHGEPGTGKTLAAQAIADRIGMPLQVIGTAEIESSEPGDAERALKEFFQITDKVLLFDECDSLLYNRDAVGSILGAQVNALLTCLENYDGTVIFTTNRLGVLDEALNRRISLKLHFPIPTAEQRLLIWKRMFPKKCPLTDDIDWEELASIPLTGGYIKNVVLRAARRAAFKKMRAIDRTVLRWALVEEAKAKLEFEEARAKMPHIPSVVGPTLRKSY
jgi:AAA+ superfamily predicted ATPase